MKTSVTILVLAVVIYAFGQSYGGLGFGPIAPTLANCPTGPTTGASICAVGTAAPYTLYVSYNGGTYAPLVAQGGGVNSFNGRTGNVLPAQGDYSHSQISGQISAAQMPTTMSCTVSLSVGSGSPQTAAISACK